jgi:hypothetical protein
MPAAYCWCSRSASSSAAWRDSTGARAPRFVTIASRPSEGRDQIAILLILSTCQEKFGKSEIYDPSAVFRSHVQPKRQNESRRSIPDAVNQLKPWLSNASYGDVTLHEFRETKLSGQFPEAALVFLDAVIAQNSFMLVDDLRACLSEIREARPDLENDPRLERLTRYVRQIGG